MCDLIVSVPDHCLSFYFLCFVSLRLLKDLIRFWWPWSSFQGHHTIKTVKMRLVCTLFFKQWVDFEQTCTETALGQGKEAIRLWWPWPHFQGHISTLNVKVTSALWLTIGTRERRQVIRFWMSNFGQKSFSALYLLNQMMDSDQAQCIVSQG